VVKPEEALHNAVADYLTVAIKAPDWWTTFPSGGGGKVRGGKLKRAGLKAGVPDILIIKGDEGTAHWIELKAKGGTLSDAQKETWPLLTQANCGWQLCRSTEEVQRALEWWGFNIMARAA
jgi:hypothetical protein